jgi:DNA-binding NtrC family response regulator
MRARLETLIDEMLEGRILLDEALSEFEKLYIKQALDKNKHHLSNTAVVLGIHRNTLAKRVALYDGQDRHGSDRHGSDRYSTRSKRNGTRPKARTR